MDDAWTVAKNSTFLLIGRILGKVLTIAFVILVARELGDTGFGKFSFALSFAMIFAVVSNFGLHTLTIRELAGKREEARYYVANLIFLKAILLVLVLSASFGVARLLDVEERYVLYIVGASVFLRYFSTVIRSVFIAYQKMEYESAMVIVENLTTLVLGGLAVKMGYGLRGLSLGYLLAGIITLVGSLVLVVYRFVRPVFRVSLPFSIELLKAALPFTFMGICSVVYVKIDTVMLGIMKSAASVGWYSAAYRILEAVMFIPPVFALALLPVLSIYHKENMGEKLRKAYELSFKILFSIGLGIAVGLFLLAGHVVHLLYGRDFVHAGDALKILSWTILFGYVNYLLGSVLIAMRKEKIPAITIGFGTVFNIGLNALLIPKFGYLGASISTVLTEVLSFGIQFGCVTKAVGLINISNSFFKPLLSASIVGIFLWKFQGGNFFLMVLLSAALYLLLLFVFRTFTRLDNNLFRSLLAKAIIR